MSVFKWVILGGSLVLGACSGPSSACRTMCEQAATCDGDVNVDECRDTCEDEVAACNANTQDQAIDRLFECGDETCDDFGGCVVDAYLECQFGEDDDG